MAASGKKGISGPGLAALAGGSLLVWAALRGRKWTDVLRELIQGDEPGKEPDYPIHVPAGGSASGTDSGSGDPGGTAGQNQAIAKRLAASYGWNVGSEWSALVTLWTKESNWNNKAVNPSSGATGIPQALPASKMPKAAQAPTYNAEAQIRWGLDYIKGRYGSPSKALAFHRKNNWY